MREAPCDAGAKSQGLLGFSVEGLGFGVLDFARDLVMQVRNFTVLGFISVWGLGFSNEISFLALII